MDFTCSNPTKRSGTISLTFNTNCYKYPCSIAPAKTNYTRLKTIWVLEISRRVISFSYIIWRYLHFTCEWHGGQDKVRTMICHWLINGTASHLQGCSQHSGRNGFSNVQDDWKLHIPSVKRKSQSSVYLTFLITIKTFFCFSEKNYSWQGNPNEQYNDLCWSSLP